MDFSIGELARRAGVKIPTIRYYEQIGLMPSVPRTPGQQRRYDRVHAARLNFIRHGRELGFDIDTIRELLSMSAEPERSCAKVDQMARRHIAAIDRRIAHLTTLRAELQRTVNECAGGRVSECRVIETLADAGHRYGRFQK